MRAYVFVVLIVLSHVAFRGVTTTGIDKWQHRKHTHTHTIMSNKERSDMVGTLDRSSCRSRIDRLKATDRETRVFVSNPADMMTIFSPCLVLTSVHLVSVFFSLDMYLKNTGLVWGVVHSRYPYMSCEIICCEVPDILNAVVNDAECGALKTLFSLLDEDGDIDAYRAGYLEKVRPPYRSINSDSSTHMYPHRNSCTLFVFSTGLLLW